MEPCAPSVERRRAHLRRIPRDRDARCGVRELAVTVEGRKRAPGHEHAQARPGRLDLDRDGVAARQAPA
jgi:hypothetical protein